MDTDNIGDYSRGVMTEMDYVLFVVLAPIIVVFFGMLGGYIWNRGVLGVIRRLEIRATEHDVEIADLHARTVKQAKQRASDAGVEARGSAKSLQEEARDRISEDPTPAVGKRPSGLHLIKR